MGDSKVSESERWSKDYVHVRMGQCVEGVHVHCICTSECNSGGGGYIVGVSKGEGGRGDGGYVTFIPLYNMDTHN